MSEWESWASSLLQSRWKNPAALYGIVRSGSEVATPDGGESRGEGHTSSDSEQAQRFRARVRRYSVESKAAGDFRQLASFFLQSSQGADVIDCSATTEAVWISGFLQRSGIIAGQVPDALRGRDKNKGRPSAIAVVFGVGNDTVAFVYPTFRGFSGKSGPSMTIFSRGDTLTETYFAEEDEAGFQVGVLPLAVVALGPSTTPGVRPTTVWTPNPGDAPSELAKLFDEVDVAARREAGRSVAKRAEAALSSVTPPIVILDNRAEELGSLAGDNLSFSARLERAIRNERWKVLKAARLADQLGGAAARRWGLNNRAVTEVGGKIVLDVEPRHLLRILNDAYAESVLNGQDLIEGEGRPAENAALIGPAGP